ncbi:calcium/proton exchanger [Nocardioides jiangxiensis]|uniref:Ca(2+)/H(+) antiporter n=1 Tax=Nocardioides jiangxiensis TaxID=3064524 RepID=A0ABT9B318_9ACTN|nr:calcium/proton exchanger [Nocardioides sp. WY-20]MDO7867558.1 calcium/proton exchanger [Nocardioides sp. WY-20]
MSTQTAPSPTFVRSDYVLLGLTAGATALAGIAHYAGWAGWLAFSIAALAIGLAASLVGLCVEQLGDRFGPGATGVLQSALGNLPELFICLFALKAGQVAVVQAALIGSILSNLLLVMGLAFVVGGVRHGLQKIDSSRARTISVLMIVAVVAMVAPSLTALESGSQAGHGAASHEQALSIIVSVVLLGLFALTLPASLKRNDSSGMSGGETVHEAPRWSVGLAIGLLALAGVAAAFISDWFVAGLEPAMDSWGINETFAGLVIVAVAGNAIENVIGIQLAARNQSEYAFQLIINSPLQIALVLAPLLVILSSVLGFTALTLVFSPVLVVAVFLSVLVAALITVDGESNWIEGAALIGVYVVIAASLWWG